MLKPTYNIFIAYERRDAGIARSIADILQSYRLSVFLDSDAIELGTNVEDAIWEAMWECEAVVAIVPTDVGSSRMSFELGAAFAWKKPVYAIVADSRSASAPSFLQRSTILPMSRIDEIAQAVLQKGEPVTDEDKKRLADLYLQAGVPVDQLAVHPQRLDDLVNQFSSVTGRSWAGEDVMRLLLTMRKRKALPPLKQRVQKK